MVQAVRSDEPSVQLEATTQFRKLLSIGEIRILERVLLTDCILHYIDFSWVRFW